MVLIGIVPYQRLNVADPLAVGIDATGLTWFSPVVKISALFGLFSTMLVQLLGQTRIFYSMSRDGLLPGAVRAGAPAVPDAVAEHDAHRRGRGGRRGAAADRRAGPAREHRVAAGVRARVHRASLVLRRTAPDVLRPFRHPGVPWVPVLGALICLAQMVSLPRSTWERLMIWMAMGFVIYFLYGRSRARKETAAIVRSSSRFLVVLLGLTLALAGLLAFEAQRATRSHQVTADRALRDYATVAAWEFVSASEEQLDRSLAAALGPVTGTPAVSPYDSLPPPAALAPSADSVLACGAAGDRSGRYFVLDFRTGALTTSRGDPGTASTAWLRDSLLAGSRRSPARRGRYGMVWSRRAGQHHRRLRHQVAAVQWLCRPRCAARRLRLRHLCRGAHAGLCRMCWRDTRCCRGR